MAIHRILCVSGHYAALDAHGKIVVTGDTYTEVEQDLVQLLLAQHTK